MVNNGFCSRKSQILPSHLRKLADYIILGGLLSDHYDKCLYNMYKCYLSILWWGLRHSLLNHESETQTPERYCKSVTNMHKLFCGEKVRSGERDIICINTYFTPVLNIILMTFKTLRMTWHDMTNIEVYIELE